MAKAMELLGRVAAPGAKLFTLVFVLDGTRVLLGMKKRGFGVGLWNGFGGKVEPNESVRAAARRELQEESGIDVDEEDLTRRAMLRFEWRSEERDEIPLSDRVPPFSVSVYTVTRFRGLPVESDEMRPQWCNLDDVPYGTMWEDDRYWLPQILESDAAACVGLFRFASPSGGSEMLSNEIEVLSSVTLLPSTPTGGMLPFT